MGNVLFGNSNSNNNNITKYTLNQDKFKLYQKKFKSLSIPRKLYIDRKTLELIIETKRTNAYSIDRVEFDWYKSSIESDIFNYLDKYYDTYSNKEKLISPELLWVEKTLSKDINNWTKWFKKYFYNDSIGYKMFDIINNSISSKSYYSVDGVRKNILSPQLIWTILIINELEADTLKIRQCHNPKVQTYYPEAKELVDSKGLVLAIITMIDENYYFIGLSRQCLIKIWSLYENQ